MKVKMIIFAKAREEFDFSKIGLFTVAIFGFIFRSFSGVWQKNDQNGPKNEVKNDEKNGYCERSEMQTS
jgi:hypothetical protein